VVVDAYGIVIWSGSSLGKKRRRVRRRVIVITIREIQWRIIINWQGLARRNDVRGLCLAFAGLVIVVVVNGLVDGLLKK
jgi:hypothetical protein